MCKKLFCFAVILLTISFTFSAFAENEASAKLTDVSVECNRLFETKLSVNTEVAAFVATLEFDESKVEFRSAKALSETSDISVNHGENGKVTVAFLNENGTKGEIISFTFKSKNENAFIGLSLEQVINKNADDVFIADIQGAEIIVTPKADNISKTDKAEAVSSQAVEETSETNIAEVKGNKTLDVSSNTSSDVLKFVYIALGGVLLVGTGILGFVLGKSFDSKNKEGKN